MKNNKLLLMVFFVICALFMGMVAAMPDMNRQDTELTFESNSSLSQGEPLEIRLVDADGMELSFQPINVTVTDENNHTSNYIVVCDECGDGKLELDQSPGEYNLNFTYNGTEGYVGCNMTQKVKIMEGKTQVDSPFVTID